MVRRRSTKFCRWKFFKFLFSLTFYIFMFASFYNRHIAFAHCFADYSHSVLRICAFIFLKGPEMVQKWPGNGLRWSLQKCNDQLPVAILQRPVCRCKNATTNRSLHNFCNELWVVAKKMQRAVGRCIIFATSCWSLHTFATSCWSLHMECNDQ